MCQCVCVCVWWFSGKGSALRAVKAFYVKIWLTGEDSNPNFPLTRQTCYHYTVGELTTAEGKLNKAVCYYMTKIIRSTYSTWGIYFRFLFPGFFSPFPITLVVHMPPSLFLPPPIDLPSHFSGCPTSLCPDSSVGTVMCCCE